MNNGDENALRARIGKMLAEGLQTQIEPFPEDEREFGKLLAALAEVPAKDLKGKLVLSGFTDKPHGPDRMRCQECVYYLLHRKWCDLPEMALPVEPDWWCRFWRI